MHIMPLQAGVMSSRVARLHGPHAPEHVLHSAMHVWLYLDRNASTIGRRARPLSFTALGTLTVRYHAGGWRLMMRSPARSCSTEIDR